MKKFHLISQVKPHRKLLVQGIIALALVSAINLIIPYVIKGYIADFEAAQTLPIMQIAGILVALFALQGLFGYFRIYCFNLLGFKIITKVRKELFAKILEQDLNFIAQNKSGDLISRINTDTQQLQEIISSKLSVFIRYSIQVIGGLALMFWISSELSFFIVLALPVLVIFSIFLGKKLKSYSSQMQAKLGAIANLAEESFLGLKIIKIFDRFSFIKNIFDQNVDDFYDLAKARNKVSAFFQSFVSFLLYSIIIVFLLYGIHLSRAGAMNYSELSAFIMYALIVAISFSFLANVIDDLSKGLAASDRIFAIINTKRKSDSADKAVLVEEAPAIEFKDLTFNYPNRTESVLSNCNINIPAKQLTVITGPSGRGKSTILNLIAGFYSEFSGEILVNQKTYNPELHKLSKQIALVAQEPIVFDLSVRDNLVLGQAVSEDEIKTVCSDLNLLEFINSLPNGFDTLCGSHGVDLSGGQKQRLGIARAILAKPQVMLLDEATSALDSANEEQVMQAIAKHSKNCTCIMVSHRLSAIRVADQVLLLNYDGSILSGTHESLLEESNYYQHLTAHQSGSIRQALSL